MPQISHSELTDLEAIGQGGFGVAYRAKHKRFGTVVYKKLNAEKLGERSVCLIVVMWLAMPRVGTQILQVSSLNSVE